ncbi:MAG: hypothetical protein HOY69_21530 [Streptomyces sp.]|nr:hypothetical protein [Streptomyces sp.]
MPDAGATGEPPAPTAPATPAAVPDAPASATASGHRVPRVLPLGAGLVLVGLGLGFLGLRLRRP